MNFKNEQLKKHHEEYVKLLTAWDDAHRNLETKSNIFNRSKLQKAYDLAGKEFNDFTKNVYAKEIYEVYSQIKPSLIRVKSGKQYEWDEVFKNPFDKLDNLDKSILVGLVEGNGGYKFK